MFTITNQAEIQAPHTTGRRVRRVLKGLLYSVAAIILLIVATLIVFNWQASLRETKTRLEAAPQTGRFVQAGDVELFIQEMGPASGPTVLFIHGTGAWSEIWRETMVALAEVGFHSIAVDIPPFGFSERPANFAYGRHDQAKRIIAVLDALNIPRVTLVGHSFGSGPTVEATLLAPDRVQALVLVDGALGLESNGQQQNGQSPILNGLFAVRPLRNAVIAATLTNPLFTKQLLQLMIADPADATESPVKMLQQPLVIKDSTDTLGDWLLDFLTAHETSLSSDPASYQTLKMPILLIWGDSDTLTPLAQGEHLKGLIPEAELVVLKQVGHIPHIEDVKPFNEALLKFLSEHRS